MNIIIDNYDFGEMNAMKYYAHPATWSDDKKKQDIRNKIYSGDWYGAEKKDGYFSKIVKDMDGITHVFSRSRNVNGEYVDKAAWVPQFKSFFDSLPNGTCLLGEIYFPNEPGSKNVTTVLGCLRDKAIARQQSKPLYLYVFDVLAYDNSSFMAVPALKRFGYLAKLTSTDFVSAATYCNGDELWQKIQSILANGGEGAVITRKDGLYEPDKRPSKTTLKVKKAIQDNIDCFFTGKFTSPTHVYTGKELPTWPYWEDTRTGQRKIGQYYADYYRGAGIVPITKSWYYGYAGSLEIGVYDKSQKIVVIGYLSNLPEEMKSNPDEYAMRPISVTAMEKFIDGETVTLRHGKMTQFRDDLTPEDCTLNKILEEN